MMLIVTDYKQKPSIICLILLELIKYLIVLQSRLDMQENNKEVQSENKAIHHDSEVEVNKNDPLKVTVPEDQIIQVKQPIHEDQKCKSQLSEQTAKVQPPKQQQLKKQEILQQEPEMKKEAIELKQQIGEQIYKQSEMKHSVRIQVTSSTQKGSGLSKYFLYHIQGNDDHGPINILRRYSQFQSLRKILYERWPGCFIPAISNRSEIKNAVEKERHIRVILSNFLLGLSYSPHLYYKEEVQLFLRSPDVNISEMFEEMPVLRTKDVISRFKSSFGEEVEGQPKAANTSIISNYTTSLRKIINNLGNLSLKALALSQSYDIYALNVSRFGQFQRTYEQINLAEYTNNARQKTILIKDSQNRIERLKQLSRCNPFYKLYSFLDNEARDAQAFLEVIIASELFTLRRDELQVEIKDLQAEIDQIALGHKTIKTIATRRSKQQVLTDLETRHKKLTDQRHTIVEMFNILEILISSKAIGLFKKFKRDNYRAILNEWTQFVRGSSVEIETVWKFAFQEAKQLLKA